MKDDKQLKQAGLEARRHGGTHGKRDAFFRRVWHTRISQSAPLRTSPLRT
jgi:hypothetical protein